MPLIEPQAAPAADPNAILSQAQTQFFIPATASLHERRPRTLKHGDSFAVFDHSGDAIAGPGSPEGLYFRDTRHLSHLYFTVNGLRPILLSSALRDDNATLTCDLANPDFPDSEGHIAVGHDLIHFRRSRFLRNGVVYERMTIRNFDKISHRLSVGFAFKADFSDLFEIRGMTRAKKGQMLDPIVGRAEVTLGYVGLDKKERTTHIRFEPTPDVLTAELAKFEVELSPGKRCSIFWQVSCFEPEPSPSLSREFLKALRESMQELRDVRSRTARLSSSHDLFNEVAQRSVFDIAMLSTQTEFGPYPYAGIPWFSTVFGRDGIITALQTLWLDPDIGHGVLGYLAKHQATTHDAASDAEPGKILHEVRYGEMAELGEVPFRHYYGSIDSTPLFLMLAGAYLDRTGNIDYLATLLPNIEAALSWIDVSGDRDGDGFVEYGRMTEEGLQNQGWKDSHDSIFHADGSIAQGPIALAEVQAYVYGAWRAAESIYKGLGNHERSTFYGDRAKAFIETFDATFFDEELGTYVLALDGQKKPCRVRASNAGHVLYTGLAKPERAAAVVKTLMSPSSFSGWGIRTIASTEARYNPMSYHNGSIWPHDNSLIAAGFARYGFREETARIFDSLIAATNYVDLRRLPELFCGFPRRRAQGPTFYPVACSPQAWSAATPLSLVQSSLGLYFDVAECRVRMIKPALPNFLGSLLIQRLRIADTHVDIAFERIGGRTVVNTLNQNDKAQVVTIT